MKQYLFKHVIAQSIGGVYSQMTRTLGYWSMFQALILLFLGWDSNMGHIINGWFPWMSFPIFLAVVVGGFLFVSLLDLVFILPTVYAFNNRQAVKHDNPVYDKIEVMEMEIQRINKKLDELLSK